MGTLHNHVKYLFTGLNPNKNGPFNEGLDKSARFV